MTDFAALSAELAATWRRTIPLAAALAIEVVDCGPCSLVVRAPLAPNSNVHGTAFAGSLFSVAVLTGWGMTWLALRSRGLDGSIVVAESRIRYRKAVDTELVCRCAPEPQLLDEAAAALAGSGRAQLPLVCTLGASERPAVTFGGDYVVHARREPRG